MTTTQNPEESLSFNNIDITPSRIIHLSDESDFFNESNNPNTYRYTYNDVLGFTDFTETPVIFNGANYDGFFANAIINPLTQELSFARGIFRVIEGFLGEFASTIETLRSDYSMAGRNGVITLKYLTSKQELNTVPDEIAQLPQDTQEGLSPNKVNILPFDAPVDLYDWLAVGSETFTFPEFRDSKGNPAPFIGQGWSALAFESRRWVYGGKGNDEIVVTKEEHIWGEEGDDVLDASAGFGYNFLDGGNGKDILRASSNDVLIGGNESDILTVHQGENNLLNGGPGPDQFHIVSVKLLDMIKAQYPEKKLFQRLPELIDTKNKILDFELGIDKIYIDGLNGISSFQDLKLLPAFGDICSTSVVTKIDGIDQDISLVNVSGVLFNQLSGEDFIFV